MIHWKHVRTCNHTNKQRARQFVTILWTIVLVSTFLISFPSRGAYAEPKLSLHQLHADGSIWKWNGEPCLGGVCSSWQPLDNNFHTVQIVENDFDLYQRHDDGSIWS